MNESQHVTHDFTAHSAALQEWRCIQQANGELALEVKDTASATYRAVAQPVTPVLAFPFSGTDAGLALVDGHGKECLWLNSLNDCPCDATRRLLAQTIARREHRPNITKIVKVNTYNTPSIWQLETDCGPCHFELPSEENIRRLAGARLLLTHKNGMQFVIPNIGKLDVNSRRILARFMA